MPKPKRAPLIANQDGFLVRKLRLLAILTGPTGLTIKDPGLCDDYGTGRYGLAAPDGTLAVVDATGARQLAKDLTAWADKADQD